MRNLYEIVEGIMSNDEQVTSQAEHDTRAVKIVQCFRKIFKGMYTAKDSRYNPNSDYVAGHIPVTNYSNDRYSVESEIRKNIQSFFKLLKSEFTNIKCELRTNDDHYGNLVRMKHYKLFVTFNSGTNKAEILGITITVDEKPLDSTKSNESDINYIRVVVSDADLKRIFHQLVK